MIVTLSGPSGVGKNTILSECLKMKKLTTRVACTTRSPRSNEVNGKHYHFMSKEEFLERVSKGAFIEYAEVHGNFYGTLRSELENALETGQDIMLDLDVQGASQLKKHMPDVVAVFILPPTFADLSKQMVARGSDEDEETKRLRLKRAKEEIATALSFDYFIVNDEVSRAVDEIRKLMGILSLGKTPPAERFRNTGLIADLLKAS